MLVRKRAYHQLLRIPLTTSLYNNLLQFGMPFYYEVAKRLFGPCLLTLSHFWCGVDIFCWNVSSWKFIHMSGVLMYLFIFQYIHIHAILIFISIYKYTYISMGHKDKICWGLPQENLPHQSLPQHENLPKFSRFSYWSFWMGPVDR